MFGAHDRHTIHLLKKSLRAEETGDARFQREEGDEGPEQPDTNMNISSYYSANTLGNLSDTTQVRKQRHPL